MTQAQKNKAFVTEYLEAISGKDKPRELIEKYVSDQELIKHIIFFDSAFPKYEMFVDEMIAEGNKVTLRARFKARHEGVFGDIMPSYRNVEFPFVIGYTIENDKIQSHWLIADQMALMQQLGVEQTVAH